MRFPVAPEPEIQNADNASEVFLDVRDVSKMYHLWESPRARLVYGLWSQVPSWAPKRLITLAQERKSKLGHDFYALQHISLELRRGESVAVLGRNGSGKSTLLQIICGTLQPSGGVVTRRCRRIAALLELGSGFNPEFTGRENVYLNGAVLGLAKGEIDAKFEQILEFAEIDQFIDQPVKTYSSGMMVRLAFAVQVQLEPELLIVDEALGVGDVFFQQKCFAYMRGLKERGCSFLIVSHDTGAIQQFCDRGIVLVEGRAYFEGNSRDAIREYYLTVKGVGKTGSPPVRVSDSARLGVSGERALVEPERWFEFNDSSSGANAPAKLTRWSCADESRKVIDHFISGQKIKLFVEFQCTVAVQAASAGFGIRDRTGQMIQGKNQYQMELGTRICLNPPFILQCEFSFICRLAPGEYTVEFGLLDVLEGSSQSQDASQGPSAQEYYEVLLHTPPVGRFAVILDGHDPIRRKGHLGMVDLDAQTSFRTIGLRPDDPPDQPLLP
jgi:lipopolysaccharide transport system ATP-binding protein